MSLKPTIIMAVLAFTPLSLGARTWILNASYDATREFYAEIGRAFAQRWEAELGWKPKVYQSHGGSGRQARAVLEGMDAEVLSLALAHDIDRVAKFGGLLNRDWQDSFPNHNCPFTSTVVFVVRKGNPQGIKDWEDLAKPGLSFLWPDPKTSGGARWGHLAAWAHALGKSGDPSQALAFMASLYRNVPVLDAGSRGASLSFTERGLGDALVCWESEAMLICSRHPEAFELLTPSDSILAEPPVALVHEVAERKGTLDLARAYIRFLYSPEAQEIAARHHLRPSDPTAARRHRKTFPALRLRTIRDLGGWGPCQRQHFDPGGILDQALLAARGR